MITRILKKEYDKLQHERKLRGGTTKGQCLLFKAPNGFYYKCDQTDMVGVKEMHTFISEIKKNVAEPQKLL